MTDHSHNHGYAHDHHHHHDDEDTYYLDQLCMIGLCGAIGAICLALYFWQTSMLKLLLVDRFHPFILASGIALLAVSLLRGYTVWVEVGQTPPHHHHHDHEHEHHGHDHVHHHHGHEDHEHGWAPWRYVVILVPIILFLLGLPNKPPNIEAMDVRIFRDTSAEAFQAASLVALGPDAFAQMNLFLKLFEERHTLVYEPNLASAQGVDFRTLEQAAASAQSRQLWKGTIVQVLGQFAPSKLDDKLFTLVRLRRQCCAADAVAVGVPMQSRESINHVPGGSWVTVAGRVDFQKHNNGYQTLLIVPGRAAVQPSPPDANPWLQ